MTVFHYPMFYLIIWSNQIFSLSFVFFFLPIAFICSQLYQRFGRKPITLGAFLPDKRKKTHDHRRVPDSVNTQEILFTEISSHTPLRGKKKIPNLFWCEISVKAYSVFFRQTGIFLFSRRFTVFICTYITPGMSACHDDFATGVFICVHLHDLRI